MELPDVVEAQAGLQAMLAANPGPRACQAAAVTLKAVGDRTGATSLLRLRGAFRQPLI